MSYYIARTVSMPFESAVAELTDTLKEQQFGVLTDIDVQATFKSKIGVDFPKYRILGACNPRLAYEALKVEERLGVLLPCNVIVREAADGSVEIAGVDPVATLERTGNEALKATAEQVRQRLSAAIMRVGAR